MSLTSLQLFKNLSDETRLGIVLLLREMGELCVCDLCTALEQSQPKISRHLAMLRESGLLLDRKQGKWVHYRLSPHIPSWAAQVIEQAWLSQQDAAQQYRARIVYPIKGLLPDGVVNSISEQLSGACTTEIAAFDEFTGLLTDTSLLTHFDHIIFDTAPTALGSYATS